MGAIGQRKRDRDDTFCIELKGLFIAWEDFGLGGFLLGGDIDWGDFVWGDFGSGGFCPWGILSLGDFVLWGFCPWGFIVKGFIVQGGGGYIIQGILSCHRKG